MVVVAIQRIRAGELASATSTTLSIVNSAGTIILPTTVIAPISVGAYSYDASTLVPGSYTATWIFTTTGLPVETVSRAFTVDSAQEFNEGVSLMELERWVARKIGPFYRRRVGLGSTVNAVYIPRMRSSISRGEYEDMFVLRRGLTYGDELITNFNSDDRLRAVDTYDNIAGTVTVDRAYTNAAIDGEAVELHALDPDEELRPAIQDALKRCFFWDTVSIDVTGSGVYNLGLSAAVPWLVHANQVRDVALSYPSQLLPPRRMNWWQPYRDGKNLKLYTKGGAVGSVTITALRPFSSLVNGELSLGGPNDDLDILYGDLEYLGWAGVVECWKNHPEVLQPLAAQSMRPTRDEAAAEFTKKSLSIVQQVPDTFQVDYGVPDLVQIGNLAEPVS